MSPEKQERFWHYSSRKNSKVIESYCLVCYTFVGASPHPLNLTMVELLHRLRCPASSPTSTLHRE
ncbi:MAG TPA: hypothetical protein VFB79_08025 [Candidatus Angelobacter sp.]|nr:hypothetical protein [Candidatus Angelobacter sp.]